MQARVRCLETEEVTEFLYVVLLGDAKHPRCQEQDFLLHFSLKEKL